MKRRLVLWIMAVTAMLGIYVSACANPKPATEMPEGSAPSAYLCVHCGEDSRSEEIAISPACTRCAEFPHNEEALLTISYTLPDGGSVMMWLEKDSRRVHGQRYTAEGQSRGNAFLIELSGDDGLLPVLVSQSDGSFSLHWNRRQGDRVQTLEQRYGADSMPLGDTVVRNP